MSWSEDWGEHFERAPAWAIEFAEWLTLPTECRPDDQQTQRQFAEAHGLASGSSMLARIQGEPEFKRLRRSLSDANGITDAHRQAVLDNLYRLAAHSNDSRAIRQFMELSGQLLPQAGPVQVNITELGDDALEAKLLEKFGLKPGTEPLTIKELNP